MKKSVFMFLHTVLLVVLVPAFLVSLVACEPENGVGSGGDEEVPNDTTSVNGGDTGGDDTLEAVPEGAVDLGLSVLWASCNVGATSPEEYGGYYAWGETGEKTNYSWSTYKWCDGSYLNHTKYCTVGYYGTIDNKTILDPEDDVAYVEWGDNWRMPTFDEIKELRDNCIWEWVSVKGVNGQLVTGPSGRSIFLPFAGFYRDGEVDACGLYGYYWSSTLYSDSNDYAWYLSIYNGNPGCDYYSRYDGRSVRPVMEK